MRGLGLGVRGDDGLGVNLQLDLHSQPQALNSETQDLTPELQLGDEGLRGLDFGKTATG